MKRYETVDFLTFLNFLAATQKVACYHFLYILTESENNYFQQNLGEKLPATVVNKQVFFFFTQNMAPTIYFP